VPAFALTWGSIVLAEPIGVGLVAGFGLILLSLVLVLGIVPAARSTFLVRAQSWVHAVVG
jgi:hypothetical protein